MPTVSTSRGSKPAPKRTARKQASKPAAKAAAPKRQARPARGGTTSAKRTPAKSNGAGRSTARSRTDMSDAQLKQLLGPLEKSAKRRVKLHEDWKAEVEKSNELLINALEAGVPVVLIHKAGQISRQHLYKLQKEHAATNSSGRKRASSRPQTAAGRKPANTRTSGVSTKKTISRKAPAASGKRTLKRRGG